MGEHSAETDRLLQNTSEPFADEHNAEYVANRPIASGKGES